MSSITLSHVRFSYSSRTLLDDLTLHIGPGERAFLVGPNGCGKSTLLRLIQGELVADSGSVTVTGAHGAAVDIDGFRGSVAKFLDASLAKLRLLAARFDELAMLLADDHGCQREAAARAEEYDEALAAMSARDVWNLDARIDEVLAGLGLSMLNGVGRTTDVNALSPGQRGRLQLAATLILRPEILILDEPTNHLDSDAISFLTNLVRGWEGPVVATSHDRAFIEAVATVIYDLDTTVWTQLAKVDPGIAVTGVYRCAGSYATFLEAKARAHERHAQIHAAQQEQKKEIAHHRQAARKIARGGVRVAEAQGIQKKFFADRAQATSERRTRNDDRRLDALAEVELRKPREYALSFALPAITPRDGIAVTARGARIPGRLEPISFDLARGGHLLLTGANGAGKSTLLNWIANGKPPTDVDARGTIGADAPVAFVPQRLPQLGDPGFDSTVWATGIGEAGKGFIHPSLWAIPIAELSAGNQRRAQIALALASSASFLIIDEPTNYLDLPSMHAFESALPGWPGTIIIASHDRWLIEHWHGELLHLTKAFS